MKTNKLALLLLSLAIPMIINAQAFFKYEHLGKSTYREKSKETPNNYKGSADVYSGGINIPLSLKLNEFNKPTMWSVAVGGSYTSLNNHNFEQEDLILDEILNMQMNVVHLRPLKKKLSILMSAGVGLYLPSTQFSKIRTKHLLGNGAAILIWHLRPNLDLGGGLALNNAFGYPMLFPALYIKWSLDGKFKINASLVSGIDLSVGYSPNKYIDLNFVVAMDGQMALLEVEGKDMAFTHQYITLGFQPKININKHFSIPITLGMHATRSAYFKRRTMKAFFSSSSYDEPYFKASPYISAGITYKFK